MRWIAVALGGLWLLMAGCSLPGRRVEAPIESLASLAEWQARGRIAVVGAEGGGSGSFQWEQVRNASQIAIRGPAGVGSLHVRLDATHPERMELALSDGRVLSADAARAELEARLGAPVPAANLRYWLLGLAAPGEHEWLERSENSAVLLQDGWRIEFLEYTLVRGQRAPARLKATHGPARIRLVIDRWRLGDEQHG
jgi:outer membrane lipoprotein LolB